ncbi:SDR family NAD(P)-dependent oxidoreductase [Shewanella sp. C32]|uniref:SDR family NAD(P)-dependent oxidoreductase n=1 Tax=Shewanella electrica TaxID=515560 RepID=A0ABT2FJR6_9GAMM|nr:NAD(P)H-binding protein [Shewanella electrica]MCH1924984.1 SDR family NAD(P)-dependent oxidoreductase [Shewanella electrica]MCS4556571.1 SDR family NAD(P)-dependent oxidoreductase [Shewanella electrica]
MKRVAVIGCGWFGFPLAKALVASGTEVIGTKTTEDGLQQLRDAGIDAALLNLAHESASAQLHSILADVSALVVNIPPGLRRGEQDYLDRLRLLIAPIEQSQLKKLVFVSSTGAYPQSQGWLTEADMVEAEHGTSSWVLQQAEQLMQSLSSERLVVTTVRFGGLVGAGRNPGRFLAGKTDLPNGDNLVNLVHLEDCITAVRKILHSQQRSTTYNLVSPVHVRKDQFYTEAALSLGLPAPHFLESHQGDGKVVVGDLICSTLDFTYQYRDAKALLS